MSVIVYFIVVLAHVLNIAILARVVLSWMSVNPHSGLARFIYEITEPIVGPIRRLLPSLGGLDMSPMIALILISVTERVLLTLIGRLG
jgi:YggT family protein